MCYTLIAWFTHCIDLFQIANPLEYDLFKSKYTVNTTSDGFYIVLNNRYTIFSIIDVDDTKTIITLRNKRNRKIFFKIHDSVYRKKYQFVSYHYVDLSNDSKEILKVLGIITQFSQTLGYTLIINYKDF